MYSCAFWCEFIDLVGVFWLLLFDHYHFPQVRTPPIRPDACLRLKFLHRQDRISLFNWLIFLMKCALHFATKPHSRDICVRGVVLGVLCIIGCPVQLIREVFLRLHSSSSSTHEALAYVLPQFDALTHVVIRVSSAIIFQTSAEVCYSVYVNRSSFKSVLNLRKAYIFKSLPKVYYRSVNNESCKAFIFQKCAESLHPK